MTTTISDFNSIFEVLFAVNFVYAVLISEKQVMSNNHVKLCNMSDDLVDSITRLDIEIEEVIDEVVNEINMCRRDYEIMLSEAMSIYKKALLFSSFNAMSAFLFLVFSGFNPNYEMGQHSLMFLLFITLFTGVVYYALGMAKEAFVLLEGNNEQMQFLYDDFRQLYNEHIVHKVNFKKDFYRKYAK
ncbi:hypothetical protein [Desulfovibrio sp. JC022]|uniref:hypothetical protein n=1 Tax=Desulfovibrio sp. JC022 TaxID=2593642 RepID=UPI0013D5D3E4|nr:hypothetical protein [Desulfovibrio sp. JC022]NDV23060.1 hypothetical protein [Desulfovibrio sp. JC022]